MVKYQLKQTISHCIITMRTARKYAAEVAVLLISDCTKYKKAELSQRWPRDA